MFTIVKYTIKKHCMRNMSFNITFWNTHHFYLGQFLNVFRELKNNIKYIVLYYIIIQYNYIELY